MLQALLLFALLTAAAPACDTATEVQIEQAIKAEPEKLVKVLEGDSLKNFITELANHHYLVGTLPLIDRIYIVDAGKLEGYDTDNVWLFFMVDHCLIKAIPASKDAIMELIK